MLRVLIADDQAGIFDLVGTILTGALGAACDWAQDGQDALDKLESQGPYDVLILDANMPNLDGDGVLAALGAHRLPVVGLTAGDAAWARWKHLGIPALLKPFEYDDLVQTVQEAAKVCASA